MAIIHSRGMTIMVDCDQLVIPGKCVVDFTELTVLKDGSSTSEDISPRLAVLLYIFYANRNRPLQLAQLAKLWYGTEDSVSDGAVKADIGRLRKIIGDTHPFTVITNRRGMGFTFHYGETA